MKYSPLKIVSAALAAAALTTLPAKSEWTWAPARMVSAEEIAASGALAPVAIPTKLSNFRYPFLQEDGSVIFIANDHLKPINAEGREGIYKIEANDRASTLASAGESFINANAKVAAIWGLKVEGGRAAYLVFLDNGGSGIGLWENGRNTLLASSTGPDALDDFGYPDLSQDVVVFSARPEGSGRSLFAVDLKSADRRPVAVVPNGTPIPGTTDLTFQAFGDSQFADGKDVVFRAYSDDYHLIHQPPKYGGVFRKNAFAKDDPRKIADTATQVPDAAKGVNFNYHLDSAIPGDGHTVIVNESGDLQGIYLASPDGDIEAIVDTNTAIPDLFKGNFTGFSKWVGNCYPWILFLAQAKGYFGIFALNAQSEELFLLADSRGQFDGKTIRSAEVSNSAKVGDKVAMMLEFTDGSSGVYLANFGKGLAMRKSAATE